MANKLSSIFREVLCSIYRTVAGYCTTTLEDKQVLVFSPDVYFVYSRQGYIELWDKKLDFAASISRVNTIFSRLQIF